MVGFGRFGRLPDARVDYGALASDSLAPAAVHLPGGKFIVVHAIKASCAAEETVHVEPFSPLSPFQLYDVCDERSRLIS